MTNPSIKKVSTADIEAAIAHALQQLSGWERCAVSVSAVQFENPLLGTDEMATITLRATMGPKHDLDGLLF